MVIGLELSAGIERAASYSQSTAAFVSVLLHPAIGLLWESYGLAIDIAPQHPEQGVLALAPTLAQLTECGLTDRQLSWLMLKGYVQLHESPSLSAAPAMGRPPAHDLSRSDVRSNGRVVLTGMGIRLLQDLSLALGTTCPPDYRASVQSRHETARSGGQMPHWDVRLRELWLGAELVKRFKGRAENQERILSTFQEEDWPPRIDDPLPPHPRQDAKLRLRDTISSLNRHQQARRIRFYGDGTGQGVCWEQIL